MEKLTPKAKSTIEAADVIRKEFGHSYIGTEHLLMALCRVNHRTSGKILRAHGLSEERIRAIIKADDSGKKYEIFVIGDNCYTFTDIQKLK